MRFDLYLESGPQHRKTWIYVPGLPGCSTVSPTSDEAVEYARIAIRGRLEFLRRHGEAMPDAEPIEPVVAGHSIERKFLGFGQMFIATDLEPLHPDEAASRLLWASWSRAELVAAARAIAEPLTVKPASGGRSVAAILSHVAGSEWSYVSSTLGTLPGAAPAIAAIERAGDNPWAALADERETVMERLRAMTIEELQRAEERDGKPPRTARRMLRRFLEHEWEHVLELRARAVG
jgi:predicted RNase H-like HicB family nuclease/uncharacterized damage-inducible protein DinB